MSPHASMLLFILNLVLSFGNVEVLNPNFQACEPKTCGNGQNITYPFHIKGKRDHFCGLPLFGLVCDSNGFPMLNIDGTLYMVDGIFYHNHSLRVSNPNLQISNSTNCLSPSNNSLSATGLLLLRTMEVVLFFDCDPRSLLPEEFKEDVLGCFGGNRTRWVLGVAVDDEEEKLKHAKDNCRGGAMTTVLENMKGGTREALGRGFLLEASNWTASECNAYQSSGDRCGFAVTHRYGFRCFCHDSDQLLRCSAHRGGGWLLHNSYWCGPTTLS